MTSLDAAVLFIAEPGVMDFEWWNWSATGKEPASLPWGCMFARGKNNCCDRLFCFPNLPSSQCKVFCRLELAWIDIITLTTAFLKWTFWLYVEIWCSVSGNLFNETWILKKHYLKIQKHIIIIFFCACSLAVGGFTLSKRIKFLSSWDVNLLESCMKSTG